MVLLHSYIETELRAMFTQLSKGWDVAPARCYRLEGYIKACIDSGEATSVEIESLLQTLYYQIYGQPMPSLFPPVDDNLFALPQLMARAPVR